MGTTFLGLLLTAISFLALTFLAYAFEKPFLMRVLLRISLFVGGLSVLFLIYWLLTLIF